MIRHAGRAALLLLALLCIAVSAQDAPRLPRPDFSDATAAPVVRVVDGDTVVLMLGGEETTVRLIGVDAPEPVDPQKPAEAYGREASQFLTNLLKGETVYLEYRPGGDRLDDYGRTLAYLYRAPDGLFVNLEIVRQGYGRAYTHFRFQHMGAFRFYERRAREAEKGLWAPDITDQSASASPQTVHQAGPLPGQQQRDVTVYITRTGTKYHRDGCRFLSKSRIPIWLQEAKRQGYTPCSVCKPPQ